MMISLRRTTFVAVATAAALISTSAAAQAPQGNPIAFEGPGGRTPLVRWVVRQDAADVGSARGWQHGGFSGPEVSVPNAFDAGAYTGSAGAANFEGSVAWYRTTFQAPTAGTYALDFQSANYRATVWVDGRELGVHRGSYLPFEERAGVAAGAHTVVVRVDWRNPGQQSREGFHRTWFNWGGLDGDVDVRPIGLSELSQPTIRTALSPDTPQATPQAAQASVTVSVRVTNHALHARSIAPSGSLSRGAQQIALAFPPVLLGAGRSTTDTVTVAVAQPALWAPGSPNLYLLSLAVGAESSYSARVGLRHLSWHGGHLYLNGSLLRLHGVSVQEDARGHGDALSPSDEDAIVAELKQLDADVVRSQHPLDVGLLERLDAAGILVWQGVGPVEGAGNWYSTTPRLDSEAEGQARAGVLAEQLHPSVFAWNLVDEVAGNGRDAAEIGYVRGMSRWIHANDPTRMVAIDVWGDHPPAQAGPLYGEADAIAETDYSGWYDHPHASQSQLVASMRARLTAMARTFPGKVLVISEFGAESNELNPPGSPGSYAYQARLLAAHIRVYAADPRLTAMMAWVLRDYPLTPTFSGGSIHGVLPRLRLIEGLNQKGLFTYGAQAKPGVVSTVARLYGQLGS